MTTVNALLAVLYSKVTEPYSFSAVWINALIEYAAENNITLEMIDEYDPEALIKLLVIPCKDTARFKLLLKTLKNAELSLKMYEEANIKTITVFDKEYPKSLKSRLKLFAPPLLFYYGDLRLLQKPSIAVCGPRALTEFDLTLSKQLGQACAKVDIAGVSGGANGVDSEFQKACLENGGKMVVFLPCGINRRCTLGENGAYVSQNQLLYFSHVAPNSPFESALALERNKFIYRCCDFSVVTRSKFKTGGSWAGAFSNISGRGSPMFVGNIDDLGNKELIRLGGIPLSLNDVISADNIYDYFTQVS